MRAVVVAIGLLVSLVGSARADSLEDVFRSGNEAYFRGDYAAASIAP